MTVGGGIHWLGRPQVMPGQRGVYLGFEHVADRLNHDKFKTRGGKPFESMTVYRIVKRNGGGA
jgi:hypothetical protein